MGEEWPVGSVTWLDEVRVVDVVIRYSQEKGDMVVASIRAAWIRRDMLATVNSLSGILTLLLIQIVFCIDFCIFFGN